MPSSARGAEPQPAAASARLRFEPLCAAHAEELFEALDDLRVHEYSDSLHAPTPAALQAEFARLARGAPAGSGERWLNWALRREDTGRCIGTLQATVMPGSKASLGYTLETASWGQGYATEAVLWLGAELKQRHAVAVLRASVDERNARSVRVLEKAGFTCLGPRPSTTHGQPNVDLHFQRGL